MTNLKKIIFLISIFLLVMVGNGAGIIPITYKSYVDSAFGFYRLRDITTNKPAPFENRTLTINQGDTITWVNDAESESLTIVSDEGLWTDNDASLKNPGDQFSYKFNQFGKYGAHIKDFSIARLIIIVKPVDKYPVEIPTFHFGVKSVLAEIIKEFPVILFSRLLFP